MSFLKYKSFLQLFKSNKNNLSVLCRHFFRSSIDLEKTLINQSILTRPKELDMLKAQFEHNKQRIKSNKQTEYKENKYTENIDLHGYFLLSIPVISFGLGVWQIKRRKWKLDLIDDLEKKLSQSPIPIPENLNILDELDYHPIKATGEFLYDNEFIIGPRSLIVNGEAASEVKKVKINDKFLSPKDFNRGYNVITPFKVKDRDLIILVNRGWLPNKYKNISERKKYQIKGSVEIIGINRLNEVRPQFVFKNMPDQGLWNYRDIHEMAKFANTSPVFLDMIESNYKQEMPVASQTRVNIRNEHLSYIVTWFGLSAITGYYWFRIFIQKRPIF